MCDKMLKCNRCGEEKPDEEFGKNKLYANRRFRMYGCKKCMNAYMRKNYPSTYSGPQQIMIRRMKSAKKKNLVLWSEEINKFVYRLETSGYLTLEDINYIITYYDRMYFNTKTPFDDDGAGKQLDYMYRKLKEDYYEN